MATQGKVISPNPTDVIIESGRATDDLSAFMNNVSKTVTLSGSASPESVVTAPIRTLYMDIDAVATPATFLYIKTTQTGNTGWKLV